MRKYLIYAAALLSLSAAGTAMAASGTALGVDPDAEAQGKQPRTLVVGADVFIGDRIVTGPEGQVQILFDDRTELVVGPRSALLIEDYLLRDNGSGGKLAIDALSGTFRFVTGGAPKDRYVINTPTGTIGVRGTAFDFYVDDTSTSVMLYHGAVRICSTGGTCVELAAVCEVGEYSSTDAIVIGHPDRIHGEQRDVLKSIFRYAISQLPLLREFRLPGVESCLRRAATTASADSLSDTVKQDAGVPPVTPPPNNNPPPTTNNPPPTNNNPTTPGRNVNGSTPNNPDP